MFVMGGIYFIVTGVFPVDPTRGKRIIKAAVIGILIVFSSWVFINTILTQIGIASWTGLGTWWEFSLYGSASGCLYYDLNKDGSIAGDAKVSGWGIVLSGDTDRTQITGVNGCYAFATCLSGGDYEISIVLDPAAYEEQTFPIPPNTSYSVNLGPGSEITGLDFAIYYPVCGNSIIDPEEACDNGANNGVVCIPPYGGSCTYCINTCMERTVSGSSCGDGVVNGPEECDEGVDNGDVCDAGYSETCQYCGSGCTWKINYGYICEGYGVPCQGPSCVQALCLGINEYNWCEDRTSDWGENSFGCVGNNDAGYYDPNTSTYLVPANSNARCVDGVCRRCVLTQEATDPVYDEFLFSDGCDGCAGQGGLACWHRSFFSNQVTDEEVAAGVNRYAQSCDYVCNKRIKGYWNPSEPSLCVDAGWNDSGNCEVVFELWSKEDYLGAGADCFADNSSHIPAVYIFNYIVDSKYRASGGQLCNATANNHARVCVCKY